MPRPPEIDHIFNTPPDPGPDPGNGPPEDKGPPFIYMAMDPETRRVFIQQWEPDEHTFPRGPRGAGWPQRQMMMPPGHLKRWERNLRGSLADDGLTGIQQDQLHQELWNAADPNGPPWPYLTHEEAAEATGTIPAADPTPPKKR